MQGSELGFKEKGKELRGFRIQGGWRFGVRALKVYGPNYFPYEVHSNQPP